MRQSSKGKGFGLSTVVAALALVAFYEGKSNTTYSDPVGIPTVCYGETDRGVLDMQSHFSDAECTALLGASIKKHMDEVAKCVKVPVTINQAAAVTSWAYNVGTGAACSSTLVRKLNAGAPPTDWCPEMHRWNKAGGKVLNGLVKRRKAEVELCLKP